MVEKIISQYMKYHISDVIDRFSEMVGKSCKHFMYYKIEITKKLNSKGETTYFVNNVINHDKESVKNHVYVLITK